MITSQCVLSFVLILIISVVKSERRWCQVSSTSSSPAKDGWIQYDDEKKTCVTCSKNSITLIFNSLVDNYECCRGQLRLAGTCISERKESGSNCTNALKCDGRKQCARGGDEVGCGLCLGSSNFACQDTNEIPDPNAEACLPMEKVCNSEKDCRLGLDETGCKWHKGWCQGFLCGSKERCIKMSQVCDGTKDCVDGSDEYNCQYCDTQFRCKKVAREDVKTAECFGKFRVCDGIKDCNNSLDETNCYRWSEWSQWSICPQDLDCKRNRSRSCFHGKTMEVAEPKNCMVDVEDDEAIVFPEYEFETTARMTASRLMTSLASLATTKKDFNRETVGSKTTPTATYDDSISITPSTSSNPNQTRTLPYNTTNNRVNIITTTSKPNSTGVTGGLWHQMTSSQQIPVRQSSNSFLAIIIAVSIVIGVLILLVLFCLIFCLVERRKKTGFWTPKKHPQEKAVKVPKMYYDVPLDDSKISKTNLPTSQRATESHAMSSFAALGSLQSGNDSGIDDAHSTSSGEAEGKINQNVPNSKITQHTFSGKSNLSFEPESGPTDFFPPPPSGIAT